MLQDQSRNRTPMPAAQPPAGAASPEPGPARAEAGIARMLVSAAFDGVGGTDPVLAAIASYRDAAAAMDAFSIRVRGRRPTTDEFAEEQQLSAAQCKARDAVLAIVPSTLAGRAALVQFVRDEITASGMADGGPPDDDHPIWRDGLRGLLSALETPLDGIAPASAAEPAAAGDAGLIALGRQFDALHAAWMVTVEADREPTERFNTFLEATKVRGGPSLRDHEAAWALPGVQASHNREAEAFNALDPLFKAIKAMPAETVEGLAVKARAVVAANWPNGNYDEDRRLGSDEDWPHDLIRNLLESTFRLAGVDWCGQPRAGHQSAVQVQTVPPTASDPIIAGIAETRAALDHALAVEAEHRRGGAKTDLPPAWHAASDAAQDAFHRLALKKTPKSHAGCQALARLTLDLREGLGLDLEEETLIVLKRIASAPSGSAGVTLKAALEDRRARADEFLALMRKDGFVPYPADKPQGLLAIDLAIPYEAERLLAIAQDEFDRRADAYSDFPQGERDHLLARMRAEYRLDELAAVVRGSSTPSDTSGESAGAILDAIRAHERAWQAYSRANAAYDAMGDAPGQTPASDEEVAAADEASTVASRRSDQAWRDLFKVRPQSLHDLWMLLSHVEQHHRNHNGIDDAPDIWGTLTGSVAAIRTATKTPAAPQHDLSKLSVLHLSRLYEISRQQREILLTIEGSPMCEERDGSGYNALGAVIEAEGERFSFLSDDVFHELERRHPSGTEEHNLILEARARHHLTCNGYIEPALVAEIAAAWGAK